MPHSHPVLEPGTRTWVWCATKPAKDAGGRRQINPGGHPTMWPVFWPGDTDFSHPANTRQRRRTWRKRAPIAAQVAASARAARLPYAVEPCPVPGPETRPRGPRTSGLPAPCGAGRGVPRAGGRRYGGYVWPVFGNA
ncbi:hypothetical protein GCM10023082_32920 [Streptomyces tremellae]|uniref:Uncharacterized protein n=1 Tax=Streptomyces tremellae TaxID=1124239 RepID=A0ABP7FCR4_9ACTN